MKMVIGLETVIKKVFFELLKIIFLDGYRGDNIVIDSLFFSIRDDPFSFFLSNFLHFKILDNTLSDFSF
jgi:hypothetical protein